MYKICSSFVRPYVRANSSVLSNIGYHKPVCLSVCQTVGRCPVEKFTDIIILSQKITFVALVQTGLYHK